MKKDRLESPHSAERTGDRGRSEKRVETVNRFSQDGKFLIKENRESLLPFEAFSRHPSSATVAWKQCGPLHVQHGMVWHARVTRKMSLKWSRAC